MRSASSGTIGASQPAVCTYFVYKGGLCTYPGNLLTILSAAAKVCLKRLFRIRRNDLVATGIESPTDERATLIEGILDQQQRFNRALRCGAPPIASIGALMNSRALNSKFYSRWPNRRFAYFEGGANDLASAQVDKPDLNCGKLWLQPGERLLDIGWGRLRCHARGRALRRRGSQRHAEQRAGRDC
jgi:hypothetical protein